MLMERAREYRTLRAPSGDGETLIDPSWSTLPDVAASNRAELSSIEYDVQGRSLRDLSAAGRAGLLAAAIRYTSKYRGVPERWRNMATLSGVPFVLSGHQPGL